jgi:hypothetical protein
MKLSSVSRLILTWISWAEVSTIARSFIPNEPVCASDGEELEVFGYSSYIRTRRDRRGVDATAQTGLEENISRRLDVSYFKVQRNIYLLYILVFLFSYIIAPTNTMLF